MDLLEIFDPKAKPRPIGIDLGTTNSLVAYVRDGRPEVIADCNDVSVHPSAVYYDEHGHAVVGVVAKAYAAEHPRETILSVKRFMGRGGDDPETKQLGPYEFAPTGPDQSNVVRFRVRGKTLTPIEVSAEILRSMKRLAEDELRAVGGCVITVPAYFDDAQRQATKDAGRLAGLTVLRLLNEPTAAALAYGLDSKKNGLFAVYDFGGGTFDITILHLDDGVFQVKSTGGDSALGGDDMDRLIGESLMQRFAVSEAARREPTVIRQFLELARQTKHALTDADETSVQNPVGQGVLLVTREWMNELIKPLLDRTGVACRRALRDAGVVAAKLDGVILVGGSTRVPAVRDYVRMLFARDPLTDVDPEQVVALGAAISANQLAGESAGDDILLMDVLPLSIGIEVGAGVVDKVLPRNTAIPAGARATYTTQEDGQTGFVVHVVQGERELAKDCRSLAKFTLKNIPPMQAGLPRLEVTFDVDADGLLKVRAREAITGAVQVVEVAPSFGLDDETVETMLLAALEHGEGDLEERRLLENRIEAKRILRGTMKALVVDKDLLQGTEEELILAAIHSLSESIDGSDAGTIARGIEMLDRTTKAFAGRRMNRALAQVVQGQDLAAVEERVQDALGVDEAHALGGFR